MTPDELRVVTRYAVECAAPVLPLFEQARPDDPRPRAALDAARTFVNGARRTSLQRVAATDAHRAAADATTEPARHAAGAAADAAAAAYLHPPEAVRTWKPGPAREAQVGHILRAAAHAARAAELAAGDDPGAGDRHIEEARRCAGSALVDVLRQYPRPPVGRGRFGQLVHTLDAALRDG